MAKKFFVVTSGHPANGEVYDREVHFLAAENAEEAIQMCQIDTSECSEWVWGPNAWEKASFEEALRFFLYRASQYSFLAVHGLGHAAEIKSAAKKEGIIIDAFLD